VLLFVREHRREGGRAGGVTEPFRCLGFARYVSHEGERILFVHHWRFAGGWSGRSRRGGCRGWGWRCEGVEPGVPLAWLLWTSLLRFCPCWPTGWIR
jgi:hypothetical protein